MSSSPEINSGACMLARLAYLLHLVGALGAVFSTVGGIARPDAVLLLQAGLFLTFSLALRLALRRAGWLQRCEESFDELGRDEPGPGQEPDARLRTLLEERSAMEERRGTSAFDPWEFLALQHEIDERLLARRGDCARRSGGTDGAS